MDKFLKFLLAAAMGLAATAVLVSGAAAQATAGKAVKPGTVILAQNAREKQEKPKAPKKKKAKPKAKRSEEPDQRMFERGYTKEGIPEPPSAAGTKKIGGQTIRNRETPKSE